MSVRPLPFDEGSSAVRPGVDSPANSTYPACPVTPIHCGVSMIETTTVIDREMQSWRFRCPCCGYSILIHDEPDGATDSGPTAHPAGSEGKVRVMCLRARLGLPLFHADDSGAGVAPGMRPAAGGDASIPSRGVKWDEKRGAYRVRVKAGGERVYLGLFVELAVAQRAAALARAGKVGEAKALGSGVVKGGESGRKVRGRREG